MKKFKPGIQILLFCFAGSIIRIIFGILLHPWNQAPDQIAWGIVLEHGNFSYAQLIHYPYEGGTILISLLCHFIQLFTNFNSLAIAAILLDSVSRFIQLYIVRKIFNDRIFFFFAAWTIFATPTLIPWGTVNFGLHALSGFFPFLLLYLLWKSENTKKHQFWNGIFLGVAFWFAYSNFVLIPVYFIYQFYSGKKERLWIYSLLSLSIVLAAHFITRHFADAGFHLDKNDLTSIRGMNFGIPDLQGLKNILHAWTGPLAVSAVAVAVANSDYFWLPLKYFWLLFVFIGIGECLKSVLKKELDKRIIINLLTIILFIVIYAISPFYPDMQTIGNYVTFRHLTYILPLIALFTIIGLDKMKYKTIGLSLFLALSIYSSMLLFTQKRSDYLAEKEAGWILGQKFGDDPANLSGIISSSSHYNHSVLFQGVGWGLSSDIFRNAGEDSTAIHSEIHLLINLVNRFPEENRRDVIEGIIFSFNKNITPELDKRILLEFQKEFVGKE
jgi:hypothetical protein